MGSNHNIPSHLIAKFNRYTAYIVESGIYNFYWDWAKKLIAIQGQGEQRKGRTGFQTFSLRQFKFFVILYLIFMALAIVVFIMEMFWFYGKEFIDYFKF